MFRVLNLYAGLGGNRKLWSDAAVTAIENDTKIAAAYRRLYPDDVVVEADAHQYLLTNFGDFDFIWSSPPCQSHTRFIRTGRNRKPLYPDFKLYEEIVFLSHNFGGSWVVENVVPYYTPLVKPSQRIGRHLFWSNFNIDRVELGDIPGTFKHDTLSKLKVLQDWLGIDAGETIYYKGNHCPAQVYRNCVHPFIGSHVYNCRNNFLTA